MKKLGFGCMRLPLVQGSREVDHAVLCQMVDTFLERGFTYFDTAYPYHERKGEMAVRDALVRRYPRDSFVLASKLPLLHIESEEHMKEIFYSQFERCGVEYFDYYLLHNAAGSNYEKAEKMDAFHFVFQQKEAGKIKHVGMSFHGSAEKLDEILTRYPELEFVQLQINYLDWDDAYTQSGKCYEVAQKHGKKVIVMEPLKGGTLSALPETAAEMLRAQTPDLSISSWGIRFAASLDNVMMVLSGMSTPEQLLDNTSYMQDFEPLSEAESKVLEQVVNTLREEDICPCTKCRYCVDGCPQNIAIPDYIALLFAKKKVKPGVYSSHPIYYRTLAATHGKASECIACGQCEHACPQHLPIIEYLKETAAIMENTPTVPKKS